MFSQNSSSYDIPSDPVTDHYCTMAELMKQYSSYKRHNQWQEARKLLDDAAECCYLPAKIELAHLYKNTPELDLPQAVRYHKAEQIYLGLLDFANLSSCTSERVMLELADLYGNYMKRPIGSLATLLYGKRMGLSIPEGVLKTCYRKIKRMDIRDFGNNAADAFRLATELLNLGKVTVMTIPLLRIFCHLKNE